MSTDQLSPRLEAVTDAINPVADIASANGVNILFVSFDPVSDKTVVSSNCRLDRELVLLNSLVAHIQNKLKTQGAK
jgi:hypothetical protein